jgi:hypothetical protein
MLHVIAFSQINKGGKRKSKDKDKGKRKGKGKGRE